MKKILLSIACATMVISTTTAAPTFTQLNTVKYDNIITSKDASYQNPVAYTADKQVYMAGTFDAEFTAATPLAPIATSAYLIKYDTQLKALWNVALQGAATITSITTDQNGGAYIAGSLADDVIFQSTDGNNITKGGMKIDGTYTTKQNAAFIAQYDANGVLKAVQTFIPELRADLVATGMYFPKDGEVYFSINKVECANSKLYASAIYTGKTVNGTNTFEAGYFNVENFMFVDSPASSIFSVKADLSSDKVIVAIKSGDNIPDQMEVKSTTFTVENNTLYTGMVATGNETYTILGKNSDLKFAFPGDGNIGYGHIISAVDLTANTSVTKTYEYITDNSSASINKIRYMHVKGDNLILSGTFLGDLAFDNKVKAIGADDIYAVALKKSDLSVIWATSTGFDEGEPTKFEEIFNGATVISDYIILTGYSDTKKDHTLTKNLFYTVDLMTGGIEGKATEGTYSTGIVAEVDNSNYAQATVVGPAITGVALTTYTRIASVDGTEILKGVTVYPNPVVDELHFSEPCNVNIIALDGKSVITEVNVSSVNVSSLAPGMYFATITIDNAKTTVKIIKK
ncbi:MAG: T9SS type A sorting domain-containing protein [Muribaculaceae bacterium]